MLINKKKKMMEAIAITIKIMRNNYHPHSSNIVIVCSINVPFHQGNLFTNLKRHDKKNVLGLLNATTKVLGTLKQN